ncbi:hypothetical protein COCNU_scaffold000394G000010 [Cocos nucifera]|nr:hypothetical protein [Cocos nucifera]
MKELEGTVSSWDETLAAHDRALLVYQKDLDHWKGTAAQTVKDYKSSEAFEESWRLQGRPSTVGSTAIAPEVGSPTEALQPILKVPVVELHPKIEAPAPIKAPTPAPAKVLAVEVISLEDDPMAASKKTPLVNA